MTLIKREDKDFDLCVYGATGFTGRLVCEYIATTYPEGSDFSWAIAGRSESKLQALHQELGLNADVSIIIADSADKEGLISMAHSAKVIVAVAGPYQLYGNTLIEVCAAEGTDYLDLCGEPDWMKIKIDQHEQTAKDNGARMLLSCGFDSIPSDLGVWRLQQLARENSGNTISRVKGRVTKMQGGPSGGTVASMMSSQAAAAKDPSIIELLKNPFALTPGFQGAAQPTGAKPCFDEDLNSWASPFVMAVINTKNVHRSNYLSDFSYGKDFIYDEMVATGPGEKGKKAAEHLVKSGGSFAPGKKAPKPGEGPSKQEREDGFFSLTFSGVTTNGKKISLTVAGDKDPGYGCTSMMLSETAIALALHSPSIKGGIWSAAAAMGDLLIKRLSDKNILEFSESISD